MDYLSVLQRESDAFHAAVDPARLDARVEPCPQWSLADLVWHVGEVDWFWGSIAEGRLTDRAQAEATKPARPAEGHELVQWARESAERTQRILHDADPMATVWTWTKQKNISFIHRRLAQETLIHRWDAQTTTPASPQSIDTALAADGVDEFLSVFLPFAFVDTKPLDGSIHIACSDRVDRWSIARDGTIATGPADCDATLQGSAEDLLLALWRRRPLESVEVLGDYALAKELIRRSVVT